MGHVKKICKDAFCMADAVEGRVEETHESDISLGTDFLREDCILKHLQVFQTDFT